MSTENENKNPVNEEDIVSENELTEGQAVEENNEAAEEIEAAEVTEPEESLEEVEKEIMEEFAPKPIDIPNYDKEKEQRKRAKVKQKQKVKNSKKNKKRRKIIKKIVSIVSAVLLFILLVVLGTATVTSLTIRVNTTEFALESAIMDSRPESYIIGSIDEELREDLILDESSERAGLADIIKDNSKSTVKTTYAEIEKEVRSSTYPSFVAGIASRVINYYLYGSEYIPVSQKEISDVIYKNSSKIDFLTGRKLFENNCNTIARSVVKSKTVKELSRESLDKQKSAKITGVTSAVLSLPILIGMVLALILMIILVMIVCSGYSHKIIGFAIMVSGALSGAAGFIYKPMFTTSSEFIKCVVDAIVQSFNKNALIYGIVVFVIGLLIVLIGSAIADRDYEDEEDEGGYIEEIEKA